MGSMMLAFFALTGAVLIAVGVPVFYLGLYFAAPEDKKRRRAQSLSVIGVVWMIVGLILYLRVLVEILSR
jgi:hypothetical protein